MLERVMRRFGVPGPSQERRPTFFEELLSQIRPRIQEHLAHNPHLEPIAAVAGEICRSGMETTADAGKDVPDDTWEKAARAYLSLLTDNDVLPPSCQLTQEEMGLTWQLLGSFACSDQSTSKHFDTVLSLLEEKFQAGKYAQAGLLLRLFETTEARRRNNERTLFYEQMITRFGAHRAEAVTKTLQKRYRQKLHTIQDPGSRIITAAEWLNEHARVNLDIPIRQPEEVKAWQEALAVVADQASREAALAVLPPARMRNVLEVEDLHLAKQFKAHLTVELLIRYTSQLLKSCYFVVLVTGRTGFEPFIRSFIDWTKLNLDFPATHLLPELHRRTTVGEEGLEETVNDIIVTHLSERLERLLERLDDSTIEKAIATQAAELEALDCNKLPPGDYALFALVLDKATQMKVEDPMTLYRVHRIC